MTTQQWSSYSIMVTNKHSEAMKRAHGRYKNTLFKVKNHSIINFMIHKIHGCCFCPQRLYSRPLMMAFYILCSILRINYKTLMQKKIHRSTILHQFIFPTAVRCSVTNILRKYVFIEILFFIHLCITINFTLNKTLLF